MEREVEPPEEKKPENKRIKIQTSYENGGRTFMVGLTSEHPLHKTDIIAALKQITEHVQKVLQDEIEAEDKKTRGHLVDADGRKISSKKLPELVRG